jgi:predicted Zn-dependent protease
VPLQDLDSRFDEANALRQAHQAATGLVMTRRQLIKTLLQLLALMQIAKAIAAEDLSKSVAGWIDQAQQGYSVGDKSAARKSLDELFDTLEAESSALQTLDQKSQLLLFQWNIGDFCRQQGDIHEAIILFKRAVAFAETAFGPDHLEPIRITWRRGWRLWQKEAVETHEAAGIFGE